jgi:hypothetical protein
MFSPFRGCLFYELPTQSPLCILQSPLLRGPLIVDLQQTVFEFRFSCRLLPGNTICMALSFRCTNRGRTGSVGLDRADVAAARAGMGWIPHRRFLCFTPTGCMLVASCRPARHSWRGPARRAGRPRAPSDWGGGGSGAQRAARPSLVWALDAVVVALSARQRSAHGCGCLLWHRADALLPSGRPTLNPLTGPSHMRLIHTPFRLSFRWLLLPYLRQRSASHGRRASGLCKCSACRLLFMLSCTRCSRIKSTGL